MWQVPAGELVRIRCSRGSSIPTVAAHAEQLAACLGAREVRVHRDPKHAAWGTALLVRRDPLDGVTAAWPWADATGPLSLWDAFPVGVDELGGTVTMALPERNLLLGGEPGAGKSAAMSLVLATAALDPTVKLWLLDGKLVELAAWQPCAERLAGPNLDDAIALLEAVREEMERRYRELLSTGARKISRDAGLPLHVIACDELAFYLTAEDRKQRTRFAELLRDLVARGRAAGRHRDRRHAEARGRRRAVRAARPVRLPARAALHHAAGLRHDPRPRLGQPRPHAPRRSRRRSAASACCSPRTVCRSGCAASTSTTRPSTSSPSARC